jgi:alpha,alpha-trehalase
MNSKRRLVPGILGLLLLSIILVGAREDRTLNIDQLRALQQYIKDSWTTLRRSPEKLLDAAADPKLGTKDRWPVYISRQENRSKIANRLSKQMGARDFAKIELRHLPTDIEKISEHGLLYLPNPYVVPGGRFNEMYGWDSYFIQLGLLRDGELRLAKDLVDNFLYEIQQYGRILNANRTYYLSRSQPPFLTEMILGVYHQTRNRSYLARTLSVIDTYYRFWTEPPHLTAETGLSRYFDFGHGPAPEVLADERDTNGRTHYDRVQAYYHEHETTDYDLSLFYDRQKDRLTDLFYVGDRSMRESGFDPSNRFGPFGIDIIHYNPVCLNTLLYQMETEAAEICRILGQQKAAAVWTRHAEARRERIDQYLWDETAGLYFDYSFRSRQRRSYPFATTFYPLWAGIATQEQARRIVANLPLLERPGGVMTSTQTTGNQWDAPFGWAPLQILAVKGLRRYGYQTQANRIAVNFLSMVLKEFIEHNVVVEKYDVIRRESEVSAVLRYGYSSNEIGFGWTNAAFTELYAELPRAEQEKVRWLSGVPLPDWCFRNLLLVTGCQHLFFKALAPDFELRRNY